MSYDIFLYKTILGKPDTDEASKVIEEDKDIWAKKPYNYETKTAIEKALMNADSELSGFNYEQLAEKKGKTVDAVKRDFMMFELNSSSDKNEVQVEIYDYHVAITIPYLYQGEEAKRIFEKLDLYVETINKTAGYFLYDPQTDEAINPAIKKPDGLSKYLSVGND